MNELIFKYPRIFLFVFGLSSLVSCNFEKKNPTDLTLSQKEKVTEKEPTHLTKRWSCDSTCKGIVLINLSDEISFRWSNETHEIVEDQLFRESKKQFPQHYLSILEVMMDTNLTNATECTGHNQLAVGDLAFLFIDEVNNIPYFSVLGVQLDACSYGCKYPLSLFDYLDNNRQEVKYKLKKYLENNE